MNYFVRHFIVYPKYEEFSVSRLINNLQWETLEKRRNNSKMIMAYKILNNKVIISPSTLPKENNVRLSRKCNEPTVGRKWQLTEPHSNILASGNTFFYLAPKLWNENVTPEQAESPSADAFKSKFWQALIYICYDYNIVRLISLYNLYCAMHGIDAMYPRDTLSINFMTWHSHSYS